MTKRQIKAKYNRAEYGLTDSLADLMFDHQMDRGDAINYLLTAPKSAAFADGVAQMPEASC